MPTVPLYHYSRTLFAKAAEKIVLIHVSFIIVTAMVMPHPVTRKPSYSQELGICFPDNCLFLGKNTYTIVSPHVIVQRIGLLNGSLTCVFSYLARR